MRKVSIINLVTIICLFILLVADYSLVEALIVRYIKKGIKHSGFKTPVPSVPEYTPGEQGLLTEKVRKVMEMFNGKVVKLVHSN